MGFKVLRKANPRHEATATRKAQQLGSPWEMTENPLQRKAFPTQILAGHREQLCFAYPKSLPGWPAADFTLGMAGAFLNPSQMCFVL